MTSSELDFEELLKQYDYKFQKGDLVKGIVCGYDSQGVMVDIGAKTIAVVPTREAVDKDEKVEDKFEKGKEYEFLIIREFRTLSFIKVAPKLHQNTIITS